MKSKNEPPRIVYSTNPDYVPSPEPEPEPAPEGGLQGSGKTAEVSLEKRQKGKVVTVVRGVIGHPALIEDLAKKLKAACGAGGTIRAGEIEVQGDHRPKVAAALEKLGYRVRKR